MQLGLLTMKFLAKTKAVPHLKDVISHMNICGQNTCPFSSHDLIPTAKEEKEKNSQITLRQMAFVFCEAPMIILSSFVNAIHACESQRFIQLMKLHRESEVYGKKKKRNVICVHKINLL